MFDTESYRSLQTIEKVNVLQQYAWYYDYKVNYDHSDLGKYKSQIVAAKVRYGETGMMTFGFDGDKVKFYESPEEVFMPTISNKPKLEKRVGVSNAKPF